jgi:hypothetical protein
MTYEKLALLRSLATRPSRDIAPAVQPLVVELLNAGYVANDEASGWTTTAAGCALVEGTRTSPVLLAGR